MNKDRFNFDFHIHVPSRRIETTLSIAIKSGLDALCLTGYSPDGDIRNFDYTADNKDSQGNHVLTPNKWDIQKISPVVLKVENEQGYLYLYKGGELNSKQGHILCLGIQENRTEGKDVTNMLIDTEKQGGIAIFPHLYMAGCGEEVYEEATRKHPKYLTGLEINGQFDPKGWLFNSTNPKAKKLANETGAPIFGFSDIHGHYLWEHRKIGNLLYSSLPISMINPEHMTESLREIMLNHRDKIQIHGRYTKTRELLAWKLHSASKHPIQNLEDILGVGEL